MKWSYMCHFPLVGPTYDSSFEHRCKHANRTFTIADQVEVAAHCRKSTLRVVKLLRVSHFEDDVRAPPLLRVTAKITVKNAVCESPPRQHTAFLTVTLALTLKSGVAVRTAPLHFCEPTTKSVKTAMRYRRRLLACAVFESQFGFDSHQWVCS